MFHIILITNEEASIVLILPAQFVLEFVSPQIRPIRPIAIPFTAGMRVSHLEQTESFTIMVYFLSPQHGVGVAVNHTSCSVIISYLIIRLGSAGKGIALPVVLAQDVKDMVVVNMVLVSLIMHETS